jgi:hypothetical protein
MLYPKIKFKLNKNLDKKMTRAFWNRQKDGLNFGIKINASHPDLKNKEDINKYIDSFYQKNNSLLKQNLQTFSKKWNKVEKKFYNTTNKIFKNHLWPNGKYICYLSIFSFGPRFLENKTFQSYYRLRDEITWQISHEMLHFIFYDYINKKFSKQISKISEQNLWQLSEIFNTIVQNLPEYQQFTKFSLPDGPYPNQIELVRKYRKMWKKNDDIDQFLNLIFHFFY